MRDDLVTVLDLGATKAVCLAAASDGEGGLDIRGVAVGDCKGLRRGVVNDLEETSAAIDTVVRRVEQMIGEDVESLVIGITGMHVEGINSQGIVPLNSNGRPITRENVLQVINHSRQLMIPPDREQIQALPREFRIDGQRGVQRPIGMSGNKLEVVTYLVIGQTSHIQNLEKSVAMAGKTIEQIVLQPLASGLGVLTEEEKRLGSVVVDIGGGTTDIAVFVHGAVAYSASIPVGGVLVTSDLSKLLKTSPEEAERLKLAYGDARPKEIGEDESIEVLQLGQTSRRPLQRRVLCEIIESRMRELATMVRQQIERSGMAGTLPGGVVLTGGGAALPGTDKLFEEVLRMKGVRVAEPRDGGAFGPDIDRPGMAASLGLARFVLDNPEDELGTATLGSWKERIRTFWSLLGGKG